MAVETGAARFIWDEVELTGGLGKVANAIEALGAIVVILD